MILNSFLIHSIIRQISRHKKFLIQKKTDELSTKTKIRRNLIETNQL